MWDWWVRAPKRYWRKVWRGGRVVVLRFRSLVNWKTISFTEFSDFFLPRVRLTLLRETATCDMEVWPSPSLWDCTRRWQASTASVDWWVIITSVAALCGPYPCFLHMQILSRCLLLLSMVCTLCSPPFITYTAKPAEMKSNANVSGF